MLIRNWLNKQTERVALLMHSSRRRVLIITILHVVLLFSAFLIWKICRDENGGGSFLHVESGKKYHVKGVGLGGKLGKYRQPLNMIIISLTDDVVIELYLDERIQPGLLDFSQTETSEGYEYYAILLIYEYVDIIHERLVCGQKEWEDPLPVSDSGHLFLKETTVTYRSGLEHIHGELEVHFQDCQIDAWGIDGEDITLVGTFYR
jgi:hypothetical protein